MTANETRWLTVVETAKLVRAHLKKTFPGVKFSVRSQSYAGGASIHTNWTDGPSEKTVDGALAGFSGKDFDGMIDMAHNLKSWLLPDGSASFGTSYGTVGSAGVHEPYDFEAPDPGAELVHFGADYVFTSRGRSEAYAAKLKLAVAEYTGKPFNDNDDDAYTLLWRLSEGTAPHEEVKPDADAA